jgi:hypothetical protein
MNKVLLAASLLYSGCIIANELPVAGQWLLDSQNATLLDPQSSGLTFRHNELLHIGDNSADPAMRNLLLRIDPDTAQLKAPPIPITVAASLKNSCFAQLLHGVPDFEALTWDRLDDTTLITVTEDSRAYTLSAECQAKYTNTFATDYPSLLVKIKVDKALSQAQIVAVRPVQFPQSAQVGNFANDGIEGLAFDNDRNLFLALEKNSANVPMIFTSRYTADFWQDESFVTVSDAQLNMPNFIGNDVKSNHPINALDYLPSNKIAHPGYLIAVARNDDQLWILDLAKQAPAYVQNIGFYAATPANSQCASYEKLSQTAAEGVAVHGNKVFIVNDPWKRHYADNIQCADNAANFTRFSPLLFTLQVNPLWFIQPIASPQ